MLAPAVPAFCLRRNSLPLSVSANRSPAAHNSCIGLVSAATHTRRVLLPATRGNPVSVPTPAKHCRDCSTSWNRQKEAQDIQKQSPSCKNDTERQGLNKSRKYIEGVSYISIIVVSAAKIHNLRQNAVTSFQFITYKARLFHLRELSGEVEGVKGR